jgi:penicillin-binding protein 1C
VWKTFEAMMEVVRPEEDFHWRHFASAAGIAWKTGTSYGNRDAWAIGVTPGWVVGVWVGNASGEGRPSLTGTAAAAPVMFDVFSRLPGSGWFDVPWDDLQPVTVCRQSGHPASALCPDADTIYSTRSLIRVPPCPYHQVVHLDSEERYRVNSHCYDPSMMVHRTWFVLPPAVEYYYKMQHPFYRPLPSLHEGCRRIDAESRPAMEIIYPVDPGEIIVPVDISGLRERVIFEVAHRERGSTVFWYLNNDFLGTTTSEHKMGIDPPAGWHTLTLTDGSGNRITRRFRVAETDRRRR